MSLHRKLSRTNELKANCYCLVCFESDLIVCLCMRLHKTPCRNPNIAWNAQHRVFLWSVSIRGKRSYFYASLLDIAGNVFDEIVCPKRMQDIVTRNDIILKNSRLLEDRISLSRRLSPRRGQSVYQKHGKNELFLGIHYLYYTKTPPCEERRFVATNSWLVTVTRLGATALERTAEAEGRRRPRPKVAGPTVLGSVNERCRGKRDTFVYNQLEELIKRACA